VTEWVVLAQFPAPLKDVGGGKFSSAATHTATPPSEDRSVIDMRPLPCGRE